MTEAGDGGAASQPHMAVRGTVRLMTATPVEMPLSAAGGQDSFAEQLEERPWLVAAGILALLGCFLLARRAARRT